MGLSPTCHMREALTPDQLPKMLEFLATLDEYGKIALNAGFKPDVSSFLVKYKKIKAGYKRNVGKCKNKNPDKSLRICLCCGAKFKRDLRNIYKVYCSQSCFTKHKIAVVMAEKWHGNNRKIRRKIL